MHLDSDQVDKLTEDQRTALRENLGTLGFGDDDWSMEIGARMPSMTRDDDALLSLAFSLGSNPGAYTVLLGAGVSASSGVPTAWGVLHDLAARVADVEGAETDDPVIWYETRSGAPARYEGILELLAPTPIERQRLLRGYFEQSEEDVEAGRKSPTPAHRALARLVRGGAIRVILTLNFDHLVEQAIRDEGMEPTVASTPADIEGLAPLHTLSCCVIHLHGDYLNPASMLNTVEELKAYPPATDRLLRRILEDYGLIIAGWSSVYDPALRDAIAAHYPARLSLTWIEPGEPSEEARRLRVLKSGLLLPTDADFGFGRLADAVDAVGALGARHPLTVPVAIDTAKRELSGRPVAIRLHDNLGREFSRLHDLGEFHLPSFADDQDYGGPTDVVARVEEAASVCAALVATIAYWGNADTDEWWFSEIERFSTPVRGSGLVRLLSLRLIVGSSLYYCAGVAALSARRYDLLTRLLWAQRPNNLLGEPELLAVTLAADAVFVAVGRHGAGVRSISRPLLREALVLGRERLDTEWQVFEVLRLAVAVMADARFEARLEAYSAAGTGLANAQSEFENAEAAGSGVDLARQNRASVWENQGRALGAIANMVPLGRPHLLAVDLSGNDTYRSPAAERLADDVAIEGGGHPLVEGGLTDDPTSLEIALRAVSLAVGRLGYELAWSRAPSSGPAAEIPMETWIDSGRTPDELDQVDRQPT